MPFFGRTRELGRLRTALDGLQAAVHRVTGLRGGGKSALVRRVTNPLRSVYHRAPPLPDPDQRALLAGTLAPALSGPTRPDPMAPDPTWRQLFDALVAGTPADARPRVLVIDDAHRLRQARSRWLEPLRAALARARSEGRVPHVVLVGEPGGLPTDAELEGVAGESLRVGPLPFRVASRALPGSDALEIVRSYAALGGIPSILAHVDPEQSLFANLRRVLHDEPAPLADWGLDLLERTVQTPSRYVAILSALARGEADWARVHAGVGDLGGSGQVAPYLRRLEQLGLIEVRRSLDAAPGSRSRRYRIADPFIAFWYRFALTHRHDPRVADKRDHLAEIVRPALDTHVGAIFPEVCRQYMRTDAMERLTSNARVCGSLWGEGYDIPVAGTLSTGAIFYGRAYWSAPPARTRVLEELDAEIRDTRYGFGRERRLRIVFTGHPISPTLERGVSRRHDAMLVGADELAGID